jgi:hypothetical protein
MRSVCRAVGHTANDTARAAARLPRGPPPEPHGVVVAARRDPGRVRRRRQLHQPTLVCEVFPGRALAIRLVTTTSATKGRAEAAEAVRLGGVGRGHASLLVIFSIVYSGVVDNASHLRHPVVSLEFSIWGTRGGATVDGATRTGVGARFGVVSAGPRRHAAVAARHDRPVPAARPRPVHAQPAAPAPLAAHAAWRGPCAWQVGGMAGHLK